MIITQMSDRERSPNTNETFTVSELETMNATSQAAARATMIKAAVRLTSRIFRCRRVG